MNRLWWLRKLINTFDFIILVCLAIRYRLVLSVAKYKVNNSLPIFQETREKEIIGRMRRYALKLNLPPVLVEKIFRQIITIFREEEENHNQARRVSSC